MSEETEEAVRSTRERLNAAQAKADAKQKEVLAYIAEHVPERAEAIAKRYAHDQPEITKLIGRKGVDALRAEIAQEARVIGQTFINAADEIEWPLINSTHSNVGPSKIHSVIFHRFYGKLDGIIRPIQKAGYQVDTRDTKSGVILPQELYDEKWFVGLAQALTELSAAQREFHAAVAADDKSAVDDLWT